jgi:A/G-specific adenine glycosylase
VTARASHARASDERQALLAWYDANRRDLPWRRTRDPYAIWVSEAMLQQTRALTVIPYYHRFLERFPDVAALASADLEEVYGLWAGLGYYSRARNLRLAAQAVEERFGGELPKEAEALRTLPGIGRYTAGAVASIAFDRPEPVVDGNVERVLARRFGLRSAVKQPATARRIWEEAARLATGERPGDLNQALMELGATVCTPRAPRCELCPWTSRCSARRLGDAERIPARAMKAPPKRIRAVAALLLRRGRALLVRRPAGALLGGFWELPGGDVAHGQKPEAALEAHFREQLGLALRDFSAAGVVTHAFTHRSLRLHLFRADALPGRLRLGGYERHCWVSPWQLQGLATSVLTQKAFRALVPGGDPA